jgi:hypothetical protein
MGVTAAEVYQGADDPLDLTVTHDFATLAAARGARFASNPTARGHPRRG